MKTVLRAIALLSLTTTTAQAAPLAFTSHDVSSIVAVQRGVRPAPHPIEPPRPFHSDLPSGHFSTPPDLMRPPNYDATRPGPDIAGKGGSVMTQEEAERQKQEKEKSRNCPDASDGTSQDQCRDGAARN